VDLKFCDLLGTWQHMTLPISAFDESAFDEGLGFDGSSIRGWQGISESDMLLMPDASSALLDPFTEAPTLSLICEIADPLTRERLGIPCEFHHHEVASGGQCEIDLRYQTLTRMADQVMTYKYVVKNVARAAGKTVTFMPKPIFGDNGSGMHTHQSLWKEGTP